MKQKLSELNLTELLLLKRELNIELLECFKRSDQLLGELTDMRLKKVKWALEMKIAEIDFMPICTCNFEDRKLTPDKSLCLNCGHLTN